MSLPFQAGRLAYLVQNWKKLTSDPNVLDIVQHCHTEFEENMNPVNSSEPRCHFNQNEQSLIQNEICKLLQMRVLKEVEHHPEEFL